MNTFWDYAGGPLLGLAITVVFWLMVWGAVSVARVRSGGRSRLGRVNVFDATLGRLPQRRGWRREVLPLTLLVFVPIAACGVVLDVLGVIPDWGLAAILVAGIGVATTVSRVRFLMRASTSDE
ncbi:hypothetical protein ACQP0C_11075 [Nocardia sp. CA-129566]|uniref:hypothetical protein n=1 Tax=Nocardia sp. CA-129566 TaxID=3239976 RepID=UPI003D988B98